MSRDDGSFDLDIPPIERGPSPIAGVWSAQRRPRWWVWGVAAAGVSVGAIAFMGPREAAEGEGALAGATKQVVRFDGGPDLQETAELLEESREPVVSELGSDPLVAPYETSPNSGRPEPATPAPSAPGRVARFVIHRAAAPHSDPDLQQAAQRRPGAGADLQRDVPSSASAVPIAQATRLDRRYTILAGAHLPCVLETALDSSTPGLVSCILPQDVRSEDGAVVLLDRGSRVLGAYQSGLSLGQRRLHIVWSRAVTPLGVAISLESPAGDALGRAGLAGEVDNRFWARFGGALLISVVTEGVRQLDDREGPTLVMGSNPAAEALAQSRDVAPRLRLRQGAEVTIQVAQDLDFAGVYALRLRSGAEPSP